MFSKILKEKTTKPELFLTDSKQDKPKVVKIFPEEQSTKEDSVTNVSHIVEYEETNADTNTTDSTQKEYLKFHQGKNE